MWQFFVECLSNGIISKKFLFHFYCEAFWLKIRKISNLEKLENMQKKQSILKKTLSSFKKGSLPKWEGGKYAGASRLSR